MRRASHRIGIALLLALALGGCVDPSERRPGFALRGEVVEEFPDDWSFSDASRQIAIQVNTPYWLPHSVTIWCASLDGTLYVGAREPETKNWPGWVDRDPEVRLRIDSDLYDVRLEPLSDASRVAAVQRAYAAKYELPTTPDAEAPPIRFWRVGARRS